MIYGIVFFILIPLLINITYLKYHISRIDNWILKTLAYSIAVLPVFSFFMMWYVIVNVAKD